MSILIQPDQKVIRRHPKSTRVFVDDVECPRDTSFSPLEDMIILETVSELQDDDGLVHSWDVLMEALREKELERTRVQVQSRIRIIMENSKIFKYKGKAERIKKQTDRRTKEWRQERNRQLRERRREAAAAKKAACESEEPEALEPEPSDEEEPEAPEPLSDEDVFDPLREALDIPTPMEEMDFATQLLHAETDDLEALPICDTLEDMTQKRGGVTFRIVKSIPKYPCRRRQCVVLGKGYGNTRLGIPSWNFRYRNRVRSQHNAVQKLQNQVDLIAYEDLEVPCQSKQFQLITSFYPQRKQRPADKVWAVEAKWAASEVRTAARQATASNTPIETQLPEKRKRTETAAGEDTAPARSPPVMATTVVPPAVQPAQTRPPPSPPSPTPSRVSARLAARIAA